MGATEEYDIQRLVDESRRGDRCAQQALYEHSLARVRRVAARIVGERDADDVTQCVFLRLFRNIDQFHNESRFDTWLYRLTVNEALQHRRRNRRWLPAPLSEDRLASADASETRLDEREMLDLALSRLPVDLRMLFVLREVEGLSYRDLADAVGIPEGTVGSRLNRARLELREQMRAMGWEN